MNAPTASLMGLVRAFASELFGETPVAERNLDRGERMRLRYARTDIARDKLLSFVNDLLRQQFHRGRAAEREHVLNMLTGFRVMLASHDGQVAIERFITVCMGEKTAQGTDVPFKVQAENDDEKGAVPDTEK